MVWRVVTPPESEPLTLAQVKAHLRVKHDLEDALIGSLIVAARQHVELTTNRALMPQSWEIVLPDFPGRKVPLSGGSVRAVNSVSVDEESFENYSVSLVEPASLFSDSWPRTKGEPESISIMLDVGYDGAESVPDSIKTALLMLIAHWYNQREAVVVGTIVAAVPMAVEALLFPYRDMRLI